MFSDCLDILKFLCVGNKLAHLLSNVQYIKNAFHKEIGVYKCTHIEATYILMNVNCNRGILRDSQDPDSEKDMVT